MSKSVADLLLEQINKDKERVRVALAGRVSSCFSGTSEVYSVEALEDGEFVKVGEEFFSSKDLITWLCGYLMSLRG